VVDGIRLCDEVLELVVEPADTQVGLAMERALVRQVDWP
jgi:hypothetical protein